MKDRDKPSTNGCSSSSLSCIGKTRKKQTAACDACRKIKKACDSNGVDPCSSCSAKHIPCYFSAQRRRGPPRKNKTDEEVETKKSEQILAHPVGVNQVLSNQHTLSSLVDSFLALYGPLFSNLNRETLLNATTPSQHFLLYSSLAIASKGTGKTILQHQLTSKARHLAGMLFDQLSPDCILGFTIFSFLFQGDDNTLAAHYGAVADSQIHRLQYSEKSSMVARLKSQCDLGRALVDPEAVDLYLKSRSAGSDMSPSALAQAKVMRTLMNMESELLKACDGFRTLFFDNSLDRLVTDINTPVCLSRQFSNIGTAMCDRTLVTLQETPIAQVASLNLSIKIAINGFKIMVLACSAQTCAACSEMEKLLPEMEQKQSMFERLLPMVVPHLTFMGRLAVECERADLANRIVRLLNVMGTTVATARSSVEGLSRLLKKGRSSVKVEEITDGDETDNLGNAGDNSSCSSSSSSSGYRRPKRGVKSCVDVGVGCSNNGVCGRENVFTFCNSINNTFINGGSNNNNNISSSSSCGGGGGGGLSVSIPTSYSHDGSSASSSTSSTVHSSSNPNTGGNNNMMLNGGNSGNNSNNNNPGCWDNVPLPMATDFPFLETFSKSFENTTPLATGEDAMTWDCDVTALFDANVE